MSDALDKDLAVKAMVVFRKAQWTIDNEVSASFKNHQLTPSQFSVLDVLYSKGEQKICQLIETLLATSGNMTVVLKNMEKKGWIVRRTASDDRRASIIGLTDLGRSLIAETLPEHLDQVHETMARFSEEELSQLIDLLKKFKEN